MPIPLLLIWMLEPMIRLPVLVRVFCLSLVLGRIVHAYGISHVKEDSRYRVYGKALTFTSLGGAALAVLITGFVKSFL